MKRRKVNEVVSKTTNSKEYKRLRGNLVSGCPICSPHKGCNRRDMSTPRKSWKSRRKTQWKEVTND